MDIYKIIGIGLISVMLIVAVKQYKPEFSIWVSVIAGVMIFIAVIVGIVPVLDEIRSIFTVANLPLQYLEILFKALGICFITQVACDICKDAGESSIASRLEMAGKAAILLLAMPLFKEVLVITTRLISS